MAKSNTYAIKAVDTDGETIYDDRINAMSDKAAWDEAVKRAFLKTRAKHRQGVLAGSVAEITVTRL